MYEITEELMIALKQYFEAQRPVQILIALQQAKKVEVKKDDPD